MQDNIPIVLHCAHPLLFVHRFDSVAVDLLSRLLQYQSEDRVSAVDGMMHPYFYSLGQRVHRLPHSELLLYVFMFNLFSTRM